MQDRIDVGIIGTGSMGLIRKAIAEKHPVLNLVALSDAHRPNISRTETYRYYEDYRKLLDSGIDAVFVAPQNKYRPRVVIDALNRGKHVFCEIPPGRTVKDMQDIIAAEKKNEGLVLRFGFNHRFHAAVLKAKEMTETGTCGKILWQGFREHMAEQPRMGGWRDPARPGNPYDRPVPVFCRRLYRSKELRVHLVLEHFPGRQCICPAA